MSATGFMRLPAAAQAARALPLRLLPLAVALTLGAGWGILALDRAGLVGDLASMAAFAAVGLGVLGAVALAAAAAGDVTDGKRAEDAHARLLAVVESSSDAIIGQDLDGTVTSWNNGASKMYGYSAAEAIGVRIDALTARGREAEIAGLLERVRRGEHVADIHTARLRKDGTPVDVSLAVSPIIGADGRVLGLATVARDASERLRLERAARQGELMFRAVVEQALAGIYIIENGRFAYVNRKMADVFGYTPEEMLALPSVLEIVDPAEREFVTSQMSSRLDRGGHVQYEVRGRRKDGTTLLTEVHGGTIEDGGRRLMGMVLDVSERRRLESELRAASGYARGLIEATLDPLVMISPDGQIIDVNRATEHATGRPRAELIGTDFADYFTEPDRARAGYRQVLAEGVVRDYPLTLRHQAGRTIDVLYNATVYHDEAGTIQGVFAAARDVTELKRAHDQLEARVAERTADLVGANKELEAFSYSVSHDLRAPLRALQGFSRILLEEHVGRLPEEAARYLRLIRDNAAQMGTLVDDLLTFSRLSRQPLHTRPVDVSELVREALDQLAPEREGRDVDLRVAQLPACHGDPALLRQVLLNLLSNALKFTRTRPHPVIDIGAAPDRDSPNHIVYFVRDNGVGFDMQYAGKLFGIFQRLHSAQDYEGTGVGLAIVQRIVSRHGGRVWAQAAPEAGATFYFALPKGATHGIQAR